MPEFPSSATMIDALEVHGEDGDGSSALEMSLKEATDSVPAPEDENSLAYEQEIDEWEEWIRNNVTVV